jgi:hypothetical protein
MKQSTICCVGYSRLPSEMTAAQVYGTLGVGLEVDPQSGEVVDAAITLVSEMAWRFFAATMIGQNLEDGIEGAVGDIESTYFGTGKKAIIHATREAYARYQEYRSSAHSTKRPKPNVVGINERKSSAE